MLNGTGRILQTPQDLDALYFDELHVKTSAL